MITQIRTYLEYSHRQYHLSYLLTNQNAEVGLIIERTGQPTLLIKIKSAANMVEWLKCHGTAIMNPEGRVF